MDLRKYLADKYNLEDLQKQQNEAAQNNASYALQGSMNKFLGGDGGVANAAIQQNNQGVADYQAKWDQAKQLDADMGKRMEEQALDDPNDPRAVLRRNLAEKYGVSLGGDTSLRSIGAADKDIDRILNQRNQDAQRTHAASIADKQTAHLGGKEAKQPPEPTALKNYRATLGKEIANWKASGQNISQSNLIKLDDVLGKIETGEIKVNSALGFLPMWTRNVIDRDGVAAQQRVEAVVQQSLKAILGAQFAQKEAEQLFARTWNPRADISENLARVELLKKELESGQANKNELLNRLESTGDVVGSGGQFTPAPAGLTPEEEAELRELEELEKQGNL